MGETASEPYGQKKMIHQVRVFKSARLEKGSSTGCTALKESLAISNPLSEGFFS